MAKPMPAAGSSLPPPLRSSPRRTRRPRPSSALLSLLAAISATTVQGSPSPPSFLCPSLDVGPTPTQNFGPCVSNPLRPPRLAKRSTGIIRHVPDKFEMDDNGRWRRVDTYTLYGSTVCLTCQDATVTSFDDQIQAPASSSKSSPSSTSTYDIHTNLPPGWKVPSGSTANRTTLILALSLVLAFVICFFIISCLFWRRSQRRKRRQNDIEMKSRKRRRSQPAVDDDRTSMLAEREVKVKQKLWAKATARWRANAKYTARQRRGKRVVSTTRLSSPRSSCASLERIEGTQSTPQIPSPTVSRRSSIESLYATSSSVNTILPQENTQIKNIPPDPLGSNPPSPPAYHLRIPVPTIRISSEDLGHSELAGGRPLSPQISHYSSSEDYQLSDHGENSGGPMFPSQPIHAAHVATDDKTLLARLADLASAPPSPANSSHADSNAFHISVPIWQDEELEDFEEALCNRANPNLLPSRHSSRPSSPTLFPPPPSPGKMTAPSFYDYPYTFDDILVEPDPGPSAPPFEDPNSVDVTNFAPSAPPLLEETAYYIDTYLISPAHDWETHHSQFTTEQPPSHHAIPHNDDGHPHSRSFHSSTTNADPLVHGPIASDGTPPCYHP